MHGSYSPSTVMASQNALAHDRFALCFRAVESATRTEAFAGSLVLGGADARQHLEEMWFVPLTSTAYFAVEAQKRRERS